ncbi:MAG: hypothetical protein U9N55_05455, partial [candidate division Zixibacteria bacterium]|nr:hypothetical protein [candidate division Zixibacteria bacterium]
MANKDFIDVSKMVKCFVTKLLVPTIAASTILSAGGCLTNPYMIKDEQGNYISPTTQKHRTFESPFLQSWLDEFRKPGKSVWTEEAAYYRVAHAKMEELSNAAGKGSPEWVNFTALDNLDFNNSDSVDILINKGLAGLSNEVGIKNTYIENLKKEIVPFVMFWGAYHPYDLALNDDFFVSVLKYGTGHVSHPKLGFGFALLDLNNYNKIFAFNRKNGRYSYTFDKTIQDPRVAQTEGEQLLKQMKHYNENYIGGGDPLKGFELLPVVHPFRDTSQFWNGNAPNKFNKNVFQGYYFFTPSELDSPNDTLNLKL